MNVLYPNFPAGRLPTMIRVALLGAVVAGAYGTVHDQISYAISPEYFTKMKFRQFHWADVGLPPRAFASEVGFLATWWVGLIAGWFAARAGLAELPPAVRGRCTARCFGIALTITPLVGLAAALLGYAVTQTGDLSAWAEWQFLFGLDDLPGFVIVAYLHWGGYLGALLGLIAAVVYVRRCLARARRADRTATGGNADA
jgi:hypothetical protein